MRIERGIDLEGRERIVEVDESDYPDLEGAIVWNCHPTVRVKARRWKPLPTDVDCHGGKSDEKAR